MSVSQIIVTSRYIRSGTKKSKTKRANYTKYIATRETVEKRSQNNNQATLNQTQLLNDLLTEFPKAKTYLEYEDYKASPTMDNASELISAIVERHADVIGNRRNFIGYMAMRPGAERRGEHGLFNDKDDPIDLNTVADEIASHPGNVWTHVISLRREDAVRLGYTNSDMWRDLVKRHIADIAKAQNIPLTNLKWYAAYHDTSHHPHIHMIVYSTNPKQGYLTNEGINKIRSVFANDIFQDELKSIYKQQTITRDELKVMSEDQMKDIIGQINSDDVNEQLLSSIQKLLVQLKTVSGKKVYGYLPKDIKQTVDDIFSMLSQNEHIREMYEKWCELESLKYKTYMLKPKTFPTLTENKEFRSVKNMIIRSVLKIEEQFIDEKNPNVPEPINRDDMPIDFDYESFPDYFDIPPTNNDCDNISDNTSSNKYTLKWSNDYKEACKKIYDKDSGLNEYREAERLLLAEAGKSNVLAIHDLGKLYSTDKLDENNKNKSELFYKEALSAFMNIEPNADCMFPYESDNPYQSMKPKDMRAYVWYRIGKMHCYGLGTEQDYAESFKWFEKSANERNKFAQYNLANLYYYGNGTDQSYEQAYKWYMKSYDQGQPYASYSLAQMYANGEYVVQDDSQAYSFYEQALTVFLKLEAEDQADDNLFYKIGRMYKLGLGTDIEMTKAINYFQRAAALNNKNAIRCIAEEYISGEYIDKDIDKGIELLSDLADDGDSIAAYKLGKLYLFGNNIIDRNRARAIELLTQSAEAGNEYAEILLQHVNDYDQELLTNTVMKLFESISRIIEDDYDRNQRKLQSKVDKKLRGIIRKKKEELGIKSDEASIIYE